MPRPESAEAWARLSEILPERDAFRRMTARQIDVHAPPATGATDLVRRREAVRRGLALESALAKLDKHHLPILDNIAYAQKDQAETSALFELVARRYETRRPAARCRSLVV